MAIQELYEREKHVVLNGQSKRFRLIKWIVILIVAAMLYVWKGGEVVAWAFLGCAVLGTSLHFLLRWKTEGWTKSWGPYKRITLNE